MKTFLLAAALFGLPIEALAQCQPADAPITGQLALLETRHPAGHEIKGWVLLTDDVCVSMEMLEGEIEDVYPRIVHLVFDEGAAPPNLMELAAEEVSARGELMEPHTAWHLGDIVMLGATITGQ